MTSTKQERVVMTAETEITVHDWKITPEGMDHRQGYWIAANRYNETGHGGPWCSDWLGHIAESKNWNIEEFIAAFAQAFMVAKVAPTFDWRRSVEYARKIDARNRDRRQVERKLFPPTGKPEILSSREFVGRYDAVTAELARRRSSCTEPLKLVDAAELAYLPPQGKYAQAASMLETAADMLREHGQGRADSAAWRIADAGGILRDAMQADGWTDAAGLDRPTGRGTILPTVTRP